MLVNASTAAAASAIATTARTGRSSRNGRRAKFSVAGISDRRGRREGAQELGPRTDPFVEGRVAAQKTAGERFHRNLEALGQGTLGRNLVMRVDGREPLASQLFLEVAERETQLLLLIPVLVIGGALAKEERRTVPDHEKDERSHRAMDQSKVSLRES